MVSPTYIDVLAKHGVRRASGASIARHTLPHSGLAAFALRSATFETAACGLSDSTSQCSRTAPSRHPTVSPGLLLAVWVAMLFTPSILAQSVHADDEPSGDEHFVVVKAKSIITVDGEDIPHGIIVIANGRIRGVGRGLEHPGNAKIIDARNQVVMPGLVNPRSRYGLAPYQRRGVHGDLTVDPELCRRDRMFDELLDAGYTAIALHPDGEGIPGRAAVVRTAGKPDELTLLSPSYLWVPAGKAALRDAFKRAKEELAKVEKAMKDAEEKAKATSQPATQPGASQPAATQAATQPAAKLPSVDPAHQALADLLEKKAGIFALIDLSSASDFLHFEQVLKTYDVAHAFSLRYGQQSDFHRVAHDMGDRKARVIMQPMMNNIPSSLERLHLVREFSAAGCEVSLAPMNDSGRAHSEMLGRLSELVRRGWSRADALKSVTMNPARLLGLDKRIGAVSKGLEADLIFLDADPLEPYARVERVMIRGEIVHTAKGNVR